MAFEDDLARAAARKEAQEAHQAALRARELDEVERSVREWERVFTGAAEYLAARVLPTRVVLERRMVRADVRSPEGFVLYRGAMPSLYSFRGQRPDPPSRFHRAQVHLLLSGGALLPIRGRVVGEPIDLRSALAFAGEKPLGLELKVTADGLQARPTGSDDTWRPLGDLVAERCLAALETHEPLAARS